MNDVVSDAARARSVREKLPAGGLFARHDWRTAPAPFALGADLARDLDSLGRLLLQFYRSVNLLYRKSLEGKQPAWVAEWLDRGKPTELLDLQRSAVFKNAVPRVIRPDLLLTDSGPMVTELDSVPGGIGLTGWLNRTYAELGFEVLGGAEGILRGFESIFGDAASVHIVVSEEAATYRPEMDWLASQLGSERFATRDGSFSDFREGDAVYRFFELFDLANVPNSREILARAARKELRLTPPPKPIFEEKLLFALLWNRNLREFWRQELGEGFLRRLQNMAPYTWVVDPTPLPPQGAIPELNLTAWEQLVGLSQRERDLILKVSGFSPHAWGARGVYLGSDLPQGEWASAVRLAVESFPKTPYVLQRYHKPSALEASWFDPSRSEVVPMKGRVRLCPYYFVSGEADAARAQLGGVLATICPADKKIIHGMSEAIFAPCTS